MRIDILKHATVILHTPGTPLLIPSTPYIVTAYPTCIVIDNFQTKQKTEVSIEIPGKSLEFNVKADLEKGYVEIAGRSHKGFYRACVERKDTDLHIYPHKGCGFQEVRLPFERYVKNESQLTSRLSFGVHKSLDWAKVVSRDDMLEMLPLLFAVSKGYRSAHESGDSLLQQLLRTTCDPEARGSLLSHLKDCVRASMKGVFAPFGHDPEHWGYTLPASNLSTSEFLGLMNETILNMFIQRSEGVLSILQALPVEAHSGRLIGIELSGLGIEIEWTKKKIRRLFIDAFTSQEIYLKLPDGLKSFRMRTSKQEKGVIHSSGLPLSLQAGNRYYLDHFER